MNRKRGGIQWVFPSGAIALHAVWVRVNAPPKKGEERVNGWDARLEAVPPGTTCYPDPVVNPRGQGPWPHIEDPFPFDTGDNNAPPWQTPGRYDLKPAAFGVSQQQTMPMPVIPGLVGGGIKSVLSGCGCLDESAAKRQRLDATTAAFGSAPFGFGGSFSGNVGGASPFLTFSSFMPTNGVTVGTGTLL